MESCALNSLPATPASTPDRAVVIAFPRRMAVCHIVSAEMWAGAEAQIWMLLQQLNAAPQVKLSVVVLGEGPLTAKIREAGIDCLCIANASGRILHCYRQARLFLAERSIEIIHSHKSKENVLAWMLARSLKISRVVRTQHGRPEPRTLKDRAVYWLEAITARRADRYISVSAELTNFLHSRVEADRVQVMRNAIDLGHCAATLSATEAKRRIGIRDCVPVIGIAARLEPVKRLDLFLAAAEQIRREIPQAAFIIAGAGREESALRATARDKGLKGAMMFTGHRDDICDVLRAFDVLLLTSDHEGLPTVVLEAMALGVPVVARAVGGIPEVIEHGVNGMLVDSADPGDLASACLSTLAESAARERMIARAHQSAQLYSCQHNATAVLRLYSHLVGAEP